LVEDIGFARGWVLNLELNSLSCVFEVIFYDSGKDDPLQLNNEVTAKETWGGNKTYL
jgi:hypothetical protein